MAFNSAGNLFVSDSSNGAIYEFTPGGVQSTFASGFSSPGGLAFDRAGNLFATDGGSGNIYEFTPGGVRSTFASGLVYPVGLAFNSAGNLFETDFLGGNINQFTPGGIESIFSTGWQYPQALAFNNAGDLFLFEGSYMNSAVIKFPLGGGQTTFASGFTVPTTDGLAFQGVTLPVPEPSTVGVLMAGFTALLLRRRPRPVGRGC
jgi:sugar lactone lactonase YvrE